MKTKYTVILLLIMFWVKAPITAQTNARVSEIFSYSETQSISFSMSFVLATSKQTEKIAVAQFQSPICVYDSKNSSHGYYNEKQGFTLWNDTKFVTFLDNDTKLLTAFMNRNVVPDSAYLYDLQTQKLLSRFSSGDMYIGCSEDGNLLFSQPSTYNKCIIRNTMNQEIIATININGNISKIAYPEKSDTWCMLIFESEKYTIVVFEKNTNKELFRVSPTNKYIRTFRMSPNGEYILLTGASDIDQQASQATLYSLKTKKNVRRHTGKLFDKVSEGEFSPDGKYYVYAINHTMYKYDIESDKDPVAIPLYHLEGGAVMGMRWISGTSKLAVQGATEEGFYSTIIDLENPAYQKLFGLPDFYYMHLLSGGDKVLFFGKEVILFDRRTSEIQWSFPGFIRQRCFDVREDLDKMVFIGNRSNTMYVMNLNSTVVYHKINIGRSDICCMRFSRSGEKIMYIPDSRDMVFIYDLQSTETKKIDIPSSSGKALDIYWDDIDMKRIFIHSQGLSLLLNENYEIINTEYTKVCVDIYNPDYTIYERYKGKWVFTDKPIVFSYIINNTKLGLYNFEVDTVIYDQTKESSLLSSTINNKSTIIHYHSLIDNDKRLLTIHNDTILRHWDLNDYSMIFESRLPFARYWTSNCYYAAAHKDGISTVATLTDNRRVVFMEIPDAPVSVYEEKITQKSEVISYPQPINAGDGQCTLNLPTADIESIIAVTVLGEIIPLHYSKINASTYRLSVENLSAGQYSLQIITQSQQKLFHTIIVM